MAQTLFFLLFFFSFLSFFVVFCFVLWVFHLFFFWFFGFPYFVVDLDKSHRRRRRRRAMVTTASCGWCKRVVCGLQGMECGVRCDKGAARLSQCRQTYTRTALDTHTHIYIYAKNSGFGLEWIVVFVFDVILWLKCSNCVLKQLTWHFYSLQHNRFTSHLLFH